jgi:hypothetical protein
MGSLEAINSEERTKSKRKGSPLRSRPWTLFLVGGLVLQVGVRLWFALHQTFPIFIPDETGYLLAARLLAGGAAGDLSGRPLYQAGYPLLISPAFWWNAGPTTVYRVVLAINSLVGASLFVLAYIALRRLHLQRSQAYLLATVTALLPSATYYGQFAVSDAVLPVVVLGWLLLVHSWITSGRVGYGVAASVVAAYGYCVHSRGSIIVLVHAGLLVAVLWRRWVGRRDVIVMAGVLAAGSVAGWALNGWVKSQIYRDGVAPLGARLSDRLTSVDGLGWTLGLTAGKIWYLIVSTWGVAGVGLVAVGAVAVRRGTPCPVRATACMTLATLAGIALATSAAVPDEETVGNFAYGRYLACLAPVLFMAGAVLAVRSPMKAAVRAVLATAGLAVLAGIVVWSHAGDRLHRDFFPTWDFPEICVLTWNWSFLELWRVTWLALLLLTLAAFVIANGRRSGLLIVAVAFMALNLAVTAVFTSRDTRKWAWQLKSATSLGPAGLRPRDHVAVDYPGLQMRIWLSQAFESRNRLEPIDPNRRETLPPDATLVVVPWGSLLQPEDSWPAAPANWHPVSVRRTYTGDWVAWRRDR